MYSLSYLTNGMPQMFVRQKKIFAKIVCKYDISSVRMYVRKKIPILKILVKLIKRISRAVSKNQNIFECIWKKMYNLDEEKMERAHGNRKFWFLAWQESREYVFLFLALVAFIYLGTAKFKQLD